MKLLTLLTQYLYQNKQILLPGIGKFEIDDSAVVPSPDNHESAAMARIQFQNMTVRDFDDEVIEYIKNKTGKMKALAHADLSSLISGIVQFLNIGKAYYFEGIGTLHKTSNGQFSFTPGEPVAIKEELSGRPELKPASVFEKEYYSETPVGFTLRKTLTIVAVLASITLVGWGGYYFYSHYQKKNKEKTVAPVLEQRDGVTGTPLFTDSVPVPDNTAVDIEPTPAVTGKNTYRFYIRKDASRANAFKRFEQLKSYGNSIFMETRDSMLFSLYFSVPAAANDTSRIKDSLRILFDESIEIEQR